MQSRMLKYEMYRGFFFSFCALSLLGCATKKADSKPPVYIEAKKEKPVPVPPRIVPVPVAAPLPGQLRPAPRFKPPKTEEIDSRLNASKGKKVHELIDEINEESRRQPDPEGYFNSVQTYDFVNGAIYQVYSAVGRITAIEFQPGEKINSIAIGDSVRWMIGRSASRDVEVVLIKPLRSGLKTNVFIISNQRMYNLEFTSFKDTYMAAVKWYIPRISVETFKDIPSGSSEASTASKKPVTADYSRLDFNYDFVADKDSLPRWMPERVWNDGTHTFIQFPRGTKEAEFPVLFNLSKTGKDEIVNFRVHNRIMIVDKVLYRGILKSGESTVGVEWRGDE